MDDLEELEIRGYLTLLNRAHPVSRFDYGPDPVFIECGQEEVSEDVLNAAARVDASTGAGLAIRFFKFIELKLGVSIVGSAEVNRSDRTSITSLDTRSKSRLYYSAQMVTEGESEHVIMIEKTFACDSAPAAEHGDRIELVKFEITTGLGTDIDTYKFQDQSKFLSVPDELYNMNSRPIFISANSPEQFETALDNVIRHHRLSNVHLAHFMLANINYSCSQTRRRACACVVDGGTGPYCD